MSPSDPPIDAARLLADLYTLRGFGAYKTGVHRPTYSPVDMESRHWLAARMEQAGLVVEIDGIGNVIGRDPGAGPRLLLGSHSETQPQAGWLDGALGVIYALEVARALRAGGVRGCVDVASWADEEGHYASFPGSRSFVGDFSDADIDAAQGRHEARSMRAALAAAGLVGRPCAAFEPGRYLGYVEAHIEQGDDLEAKALRLGIVSSIVGIWQYRIVFEGMQNHAGTTRMATRRDAGLALVKLAGAIDRQFPKICAERTVWTTGRITLDPGAPSVIPGGAEMLFQFRDADPAVLARLEATLTELVAASNAGPCRTMLHNLSRSVPKIMDARLQDALERAAERHAPGLHQRMPSGAGHDAQQLARVMPAAMLFVPSIGGISHHWSEDTAEADIVLGCQVLAGAAADLLASA
jgi:N-carbamoyl-L-amino-acid hydrolase